MQARSESQSPNGHSTTIEDQSASNTSSKNQKRTLEIVPEKISLSRYTVLLCFESLAMILINILVVIWYDKDNFDRGTVMWTVFGFSYVITLDPLQNGRGKFKIAQILLVIVQFFVCLYFCDTFGSNSNLAIPLVLSFLMLTIICSTVLIPLIYMVKSSKSIAETKNALLYKYIYSKSPRRDTKCFQFTQWFDVINLLLLVITVPFFYFDSDTLWQSDSFAVGVVLVLWHQQINQVVFSIMRDSRVKIIVDDVIISVNKDLQTTESKILDDQLAKPVQQPSYELFISNLVPLLYAVLVLILILVELIKQGPDNMPLFDVVFSVCVAVLVLSTLSLSFCCFCWKSKDPNNEKEVLNGDARELLMEILANAKVNASISDFCGTYVIDNSIHPFKKFTLLEENVVEVDQSQAHQVAKEGHYCVSHGNVDVWKSTIVCAIQLSFKNTESRLERFPWYVRWFVKDPLYKMVLHANGVVKFVPADDNTLNRLALARVDSKGWLDFFYNIRHAQQYGCFCFGVLLKNGNIKRYNRWNEDVEFFYNATK